MTLLPIVERELRAQSRLAVTYNLRVIGVAALLGVGVFFSLNHSLSTSPGEELFSLLSCALFVSVWVLVPMICADCISQERREGTVGLLFLTPLRARDVVLAKGLVHGLRSLSLLAAVLPIITITLLMGGVGWSDATLLFIMSFSSLCWALAAGLLASSVSKTWIRSQLLAFGLASAFGFVFLLTVGTNLLWFYSGSGQVPFSAFSNLDRTAAIGMLGATDYDGWWGKAMATLPRVAQPRWVLAQARMAIISAGVLLLSIELAALNLRRFWREEPPSERQVWLERKLFTPVLMVSFLRGWMRRKLERNPIGWLEQRTWSGRLVTWGWFAVMISLYSAAFSNTDVSRSLDNLQKFLAWLLLGVMAVAAAGSFRRERETGVMELLLVSPMSVGQVIGGRLRGLWGQFLPAFAVLLGIWTYLGGIFPGQQAAPGLIEFFCGSFFALPVIGLYYSLKRLNFISAFLSTILAGVAIPFGAQMLLSTGIRLLTGLSGSVAGYVPAPGRDDSLGMLMFYAVLRLTYSPLLVMIVQLGIATRLWRRLHHDLEHRNFAFSRAAT